VKHCTEKYGISLFDIEDDNFTLDPQRALRILQLLIEEFGENTLQLFAMNGLSIFSLNRELLEQMKRAGFHHLDLSLGSAARRASTLINRPYKPEQATAVLRQAADCNLPATTYIIYGIPGHSKEEMVHSLCYLMGQEALIGPSIFYPTPGTPVYRELYGGHHAPDFTALRSSLFPVETGEFSRLDLITLLRLSRWINSVKQIPLPALTKKQLSLGELREVSVTNWLPAQLREPGQTVFSVPQPAAVTAAGAAKIMTAVVLHRNSLWGLKRLRPLQQRTPAYEIFPYQSSRMVLQLFWDHAESVPVRCVRK
jgi:hypothetical protein